MPRPTDIRRFELVKRVTMEILVEKGFRGLTLSKITEKSGVSAGYIYKHYSGKNELVVSLMNEYFLKFKERVKPAIRSKLSFREVIEIYIEILVNMALEDPIPVLFLNVLANDPFMSEEGMDIKVRSTLNLALDKMSGLGRKTKEVGDHVRAIELYLMIIKYPISYIAMKTNSEISDGTISINDIVFITNIICNALK